MIVVNSDALTEFLNNELKTRSNADPLSLSRYVLALLKKRKLKGVELRHCLLEALDVFLGKETVTFVDLLLEALKTESYIKKTSSPSTSNQGSENFDSGKIKQSLPVDEIKNSGHTERDPKANENERSRGGNPTESTSKAGRGVVPPLPMNQRCKAYDEVGYCMAGSSCSYFHGNDALVVDDVHDIIFPSHTNKNAVMVPTHTHGEIIPPLPTQCFTLPPLPPEPPMVYPTHPVPEAYNPEHPAISPTHPHPIAPFNSTRKRELVILNTTNHTNNSTVVKERDVKKRRTFDYNRLGPKPTKILKTENESCCTIELKDVPRNLNTITNLNAKFSKYGTIVNIEIGPSSFIRFLNPSEAQCAFQNSPKSNFDIQYLGQLREKDIPFIGGEKEPKVVNFPQRGVFLNTKFHKLKNQKEKNNPALNKKLLLLKKKECLLVKRIDYYKLILEKMATKTNKKELQFLRQTLKNVSSEIVNMKNEITKEFTEMRKSLAAKKPTYHHTHLHSEKALLDAEMDFYHSKSLLRPSKSSEETNKKDLLSEVNELKEKAKWLGLYEKDPVCGPQSPTLAEPNLNEISERSSLSEISLATVSVQEQQHSTEQSSDVSKSDSLLLGDDEEEDEEEDSEARSWRR